jgi:hypothetical protein
VAPHRAPFLLCGVWTFGAAHASTPEPLVFRTLSFHLSQIIDGYLKKKIELDDRAIHLL